MARAFAYLFISICALFSSSTLASVLAIDYGTDWSKASIVKPGIPFDVVLNKDSKRKIQSSIGWKRDERLFASEAFNIATRYPGDSFSFLKYLQGRLLSSSPAITEYGRVSPSTHVLPSPERDTALLRRPDGTEWSVEELTAMQFAYIKELAEGVAGEKVRDVVVAIPAHFTQFQRQAILDAIEIAGLKSLSLINDGAAVAINYAMTRSFPTKETHIIYDAGASSTRATLATFITINNATSIEIKAYGYDLSSGGNELSERLRKILTQQFEAKIKKSIFEDDKAKAKLWKEAERVKAVLSANAESTVTIESLSQEVDFRSKISRADFEHACSDLSPRFAQPIFDVLTSSGLTLADIDSVVLTGGHSRVPMVQSAIRAAVGEDKIAQNVNADESTVLGAAFYGASLVPQFKTKIIKIQDIATYDIQVSYSSEAKTEESKPRTIKTLIFGSGSKAATKKTLTLKRKDDFPLQISYKSQAPGSPEELIDIDVSGIPEALANLTSRGAQEPVIKITVLLSESGIVSVEDAVAYGEIKDDSIAGKLKNLFAGSSSSTTSTASDGENGTSAEPTPTAEPAKKEEETPVAVKKEPNTIPLTLTVTPLSVQPLTVEEKRKSRKRLTDLDLAEQYRRRKEEARNGLEAYLYRLREPYETDIETETQTVFFEYSTPEERASLKKLLDETFEWMSEKAEQADTADFKAKKTALEKIEGPILKRVTEDKAVPTAVNLLKEVLSSGRSFLVAARNTTNTTDDDTPSRFTPLELDDLETAIATNEVWLEEQLSLQQNRKRNENRVLGSKELVEKGKELQEVVERLMKRKMPKRPKAKVTLKPSATPTTTESVASETSVSDAEETSSSTTVAAEETPVRHEEL